MYDDMIIVLASLVFVCCYFFMRKLRYESVPLSLMTSFIVAIVCCAALCLICTIGPYIIASLKECIRQHKKAAIVALVACIVVVTDAIVYTIRTAYRRRQNRVRQKLTRLLS